MVPTDQDLVRAALKDAELLTPLIERYQSRLFRYIQRLGSVDAETAKDIVQETFIRIYAHLHDYDTDLPFSSWIYRIAHNEAMRQFRRQKNRPGAVEFESDLSLFAAIPDELNIELDVERSLTGKHITSLIERLKPMYRDILILRFYEEKDYAEMSDILQLPMGTVATNLSRAKAKLKELLAERHILDT
jgi:RNA polymerase sigma-70 factor (ECF subfamily)